MSPSCWHPNQARLVIEGAENKAQLEETELLGPLESKKKAEGLLQDKTWA